MLFLVIIVSLSFAHAQVAEYGQCGGKFKKRKKYVERNKFKFIIKMNRHWVDRCYKMCNRTWLL